MLRLFSADVLLRSQVHLYHPVDVGTGDRRRRGDAAAVQVLPIAYPTAAFPAAIARNPQLRDLLWFRTDLHVNSAHSSSHRLRGSVLGVATADLLTVAQSARVRAQRGGRHLRPPDVVAAVLHDVLRADDVHDGPGPALQTLRWRTLAWLSSFLVWWWW